VERQDEEAVRVNGRETSVDALAAQLSTGTHVVSERIRQGAYAEGLYPHAVNTVRVVTMRDEQGPFLAFAVQRIGTAASTPTDNLNLGGLAAPIDRDTGVLGPAKRLEADRPATAHHHHPETGAAIAGAQVPGWDDLAGHALDLMEALPELRYVGWDLILREEGPLVLEGNSYPGVQVAQLHAPLGEDPRIARFFGRAPELAREAEHRDRASDG